MEWILAVSLTLTTVACVAVGVLWRRLIRLEARFDERRLQAKLQEELEMKWNAFLARIESRPPNADAYTFEEPAQLYRVATSQTGRGGQPGRVARPALNTDAVRRLARAGEDVGSIAQKLGMGKGEVQLILDLSEERA